jgi:hypothetical protein
MTRSLAHVALQVTDLEGSLRDAEYDAWQQPMQLLDQNHSTL